MTEEDLHLRSPGSQRGLSLAPKPVQPADTGRKSPEDPGLGSGEPNQQLVALTDGGGFFPLSLQP